MSHHVTPPEIKLIISPALPSWVLGLQVYINLEFSYMKSYNKEN